MQYDRAALIEVAASAFGICLQKDDITTRAMFGRVVDAVAAALQAQDSKDGGTGVTETIIPPQPIAGVVIKQQSDRIFEIWYANPDMAETIEKDIAKYGSIHKSDWKPKFLLFIHDLYRPAEIIKYLQATYGEENRALFCSGPDGLPTSTEYIPEAGEGPLTEDEVTVMLQRNASREMTICLSFGHYGGFYVSWGYCKRLCLGWVAITIMPLDIDRLLEGL